VSDSERDDDPTGGGASRSTARASLAGAPTWPADDLPPGDLRPPLDFGPGFGGGYRYEIQAIVGRGNMGAVYRAYDRCLDTLVALKVPLAKRLRHPGIVERFYAEARAACRLRHPYLCQVLDIGHCAGTYYLTMTFVDGQPLSGCAVREPRAVAGLVRKLAEGMAEAHRLKVIHRDLKPSNILLTAGGDPVITDFGIALRMDAAERLTDPGAFVGTLHYAAPEQVRGDADASRAACDVYGLGVVQYELLAGRVPFLGGDKEQLKQLILTAAPPRPSSFRPDVDPRLEAIALRALAKRPEDRFRSMTDFADALAEYLGEGAAPPQPRPAVSRSSLYFRFAGMGERAPAAGPADRLYLDVGNDLRPGVIDHHHLTAYSGATASMVLDHAAFLTGALAPTRRPDDPFVIVLHEKPDLDCLASAYLAIAYLTTGAFPDGAEELAHYVGRVDEGSLGMTLSNPFSLYAAYQQLANRLLRQNWPNVHLQWQERIARGLGLVAFVLEQVARHHTPLPAVDAFACPGLFTPEDREEVRRDVERYHRKLADPRCHARCATLRLPGRFGGTVDVAALLARDVENADDPGRCAFFKDWARTDCARCPGGPGFVGLSVFLSEGPSQKRRCILSVTPDSGASLRGLAALLEEAETRRRTEVFGVDDRVADPVTGEPKPTRPGYGNADPWYDGRAHGYTIVDAPRSGTHLTADEIEGLFLKFGGCTTPPAPLR
jgi:serine/threonine protein kinase